jgi:DNA-binding response OmpR family regulator
MNTILVADDDIVSRTMVVTLLQKSGLEVISCENGRQALEKLTGPGAPRLAILDWVMPELDGPDVIRAVREQNDTHPYLLLLSNRNETSDKVAGLDAGADDYLTKPVNANELKARVNVGQRFLALQDELEEKTNRLLRLEHQHKAASLAQMAGGVAHHFNNKLQAVIGYLDLMVIEHPGRHQPDCEELILLKRTRAAAEEAANIGRKLLTYLSQNRGKPEPLDVAPLLDKVLKELRLQFPVLENASVKLSGHSNTIYANPDEFHEVIEHILKNALEADPNNAPVISVNKIRGDQLPDVPPGSAAASTSFEIDTQTIYILIQIEDSGPGIHPEMISQVFDPFVTTKFTGRGLGLAVCSGIVKKVNGAIRIICPPGGGTSVLVCIPEHSVAEYSPN